MAGVEEIRGAATVRPVMADSQQDPDVFVPNPAFAEEWDNPEMAAFKREEAREREIFAKSHTREEWLAAIDDSPFRGDFIIRVAKPPKRFPFKAVKLTW
jgi:hypothetical protein